jgi:hypothetical protein
MLDVAADVEVLPRAEVQADADDELCIATEQIF